MQDILQKRSYKWMIRLKNFNLKFDRTNIWNVHIKTKCVTSVIVTLGDLNITQISAKDHQVTYIYTYTYVPYINVSMFSNAHPFSW